jgi:hypothetical protein
VEGGCSSAFHSTATRSRVFITVNRRQAEVGESGRLVEHLAVSYSLRPAEGSGHDAVRSRTALVIASVLAYVTKEVVPW